MRGNPDHDTLGNLVGREAGNGSDPETPPQSEIARDPNQINIQKVIDKLVGDVEGENDQSSDEDDEERTSDVNVNAQTEQGQQRQPRER
jgi:hypothetical protein